MRKKRVGFITSYPGAKTGFSRNIKALLPFLYKKDKYELFLLAQGMPHQNPDFMRWPWHTEGAFQGAIDHSKINTDEGYRRMVSYGNVAVEEFVRKHKLDVVFHVEDGWSSDPNFYFKKDWFKHIKQNFVNWTTADSLPILSLFKDWAQNCPNIWFWTSFAEKALKTEDGAKYGHVKTVHGCLNTDEFAPISPQEKANLRGLFNIPQDELIFSFVARNQLRKLFWANMQGLARLKRSRPSCKAKLLFHTSWSEGWSLPQFIEEFGLNKDDVYTTYVCRACGAFEIKPFNGEEKDCKFCGAAKAQITANVITGVSEANLAKVYGISDAYLHLMTSGGLEYGLVEAALCGLPIATVPYSCGEDFTVNDFVSTIDCAYTREIGTNFIKATPNINSVLKYMQNIADMSPQKRAEIGSRTRNWALKEFDVSKIGAQVEEFIDSRDLVDWEAYNPSQAVVKKDPDYPMPSQENNLEWLLDMYLNILKLELPESDGGVQHWLNALRNGMSREDIYKYFTEVARTDNAKAGFETAVQKLEDLFDKDDYGKRILFVMKESAGDIFMATSLLESCKRKYPDHNIYFACEPKYFDLLDANPHIHKVIPYVQQMENEIGMIGHGNNSGIVDVLYLPFILTQRHLNYLSNKHLDIETK
jgi:glycosyltransferase involved in cell wall biosynthesis